MHKNQGKRGDLRKDTEIYPKCEEKVLATKHRFRCECSINVDYKGAGVGQWTGFKRIRWGPFIDSYKN
jgi:hypothetical protein